MWPNLSYLLHDLFGTARDNAFSVVQMFGLLLGAAFFVAAYVLYIELKRKEEEGLIHSKKIKEVIGGGPKWSDVVTNGLFGLVLGLKLPGIISDFSTFKEDAAGYIFSSQGNLYIGLIAMIIFGGYTYREGMKKKLDKPKAVTRTIHPYQRTGDMTVIAAIFGILGARLFSILENFDSFAQDPFGQLFSGSGLTIHGGLILAFIANYIYVKRNQIAPIHVMDAIAPALILSYAVGRLGCQLSGDGDWGIINELARPGWFVLPDWMWAYDYPNNVLNEGVPIEGCTDKYCRRLSPPVFPTPLYETIAGTLIFVILWVLRKRVAFTGFIFFLYLVLMSIERFFVEFIRVNPRYDFLGMQLSQAQIISIGLFMAGMAGLMYWYRRRTTPVKAT